MASSASSAGPKRRANGKLTKLTPDQKKKRAERRQRKKTWAARVWVRRHVKGEY